MSHSIGIIGGADGPTAIFVTGDPSAAVFVLAAVILAAVLLIRYFRKK